MAETDLNRRVVDRRAAEQLAARYNTWGRWGSDDQLGKMNLITPERVVAAAQLVKKGRVFSLALPFDRLGPQGGASGPLDKRIDPQHFMLTTPSDPLLDDEGRHRFSDDAIFMPLQSSTQWDALCHMFYLTKGYNGRGWDSVDALRGAQFNSITNVKDRAVGRGVLLDLPRFFGRDWLETSYAIQGTDLERCAEDQGVRVGEGDFLLIRTGQLAERRAAGSWADFSGGPAPGLGVSAAEFVCERDVVAVASDTWGVEVLPYETADVLAPLHMIFLVNAGVLLGEMWDVEKLSADCREDGVYEFFLSAQPLTITGSVGSPLNPIAIK
jgi:kynurenine formamidase